MYSINKFILDLQKSQSQIAIPIQKGDTARKWLISFSDAGKKVKLERGVLAKIEIKRPTGTQIEMFCPILDETTVVYDFGQYEGSAAVEGVHDCAVILYTESSHIGTAHFTMVVSERAIDNYDLSDEDQNIIDSIVEAEAARQNVETTREENEAARIVAEAERVAAEITRESSTEKRLKAIDDKVDEVDSMLVDGEFNGEDGISPTVTIANISGGHRVTITDANGTKTFDVFDGEKGDKGSVAEYTVKTELNHDTYVLTVSLIDDEGNVVASDEVDFPLESVVVGGDEENGTVTLTLNNGNTVQFYIGDLVEGLVGENEFNTLKTKVVTLEGEIADLKYKEIVINSFGAAPSTAEMGSTVNGVSLFWGTNKTPTALTLDGASIDASTTSKTVTDTFASNKTWTLVATDERGATSTKTATLSFLNGVYYGVSNLTEITDSNGVLATFRDALTKNLRSGKSTSFSANAGEGEYIYYLLPKRMGTCSFNVGGFDGGFNLINTVNLKNASGYTEEYYIYRSENVGLGQTTVKVA